MKNEFITLATLTYMRAQLLSAQLEQKGIESFMANVNQMKEGPGVFMSSSRRQTWKMPCPYGRNSNLPMAKINSRR